jgi:peroxiredoxin
MKKLFVLIVSIALFASCNNNGDNNNTSGKQSVSTNYTIHGTIDGDFTGTVYLKKRGDGEWITLDSTTAQNNSFEFKGSMGDPEIYYIMLEGNRQYCRLFAENSEITVKINPNDMRNPEITGSKSDKEFKGFQEQSASYENQLNEMWNNMKKAKNAGDDATAKMWEDKLDSVDAIRRQFALDYAMKNNKSVVSAFVVYLNSYSYDENQLEKVLNNFDPSVRNSEYAKILQERVDILKKVAIGKKATDFTMNDPDGKPVTLSSLYGKYLLIDFWASWCSPCRAENPNLVATYNKYHSKGFNILGVSFDKDKKNWLKAIKDDHLTWLHVSDLKGWGNEAGKLYGVSAIPSNVLLDPDGIIIAKGLRGDDLNDKLKDIFGE